MANHHPHPVSFSLHRRMLKRGAGKGRTRSSDGWAGVAVRSGAPAPHGCQLPWCCTDAHNPRAGALCPQTHARRMNPQTQNYPDVSLGGHARFATCVDYKETNGTDGGLSASYPMYQDVHVMIFVSLHPSPHRFSTPPSSLRSLLFPLPLPSLLPPLSSPRSLGQPLRPLPSTLHRRRRHRTQCWYAWPAH